MLEPMADFFESRLGGYDTHMMQNIHGAEEFYPFTAQCLPQRQKCRILDLGCGTGLELEHYFPLCPTAHIIGIDLSAAMLEALRQKFTGKDLTLLCVSYFDAEFPQNLDAAVSVESLHHFTKAEKIPLYAKLHTALKDDGYFILTDYFAASEEEEQLHRQTYLAERKAQGITDEGFYHYDTPLTVQHETEALLEAGFSSVEVLRNWQATYTIKAYK